jgi:fermentation-respiration switch protein FrsA (DUF1100 family)
MIMKSSYRYWVRIAIAIVLSLVITFAGTLVLFSYQQTQDYLHPARQRVSEELLNTYGIEHQKVELTTEDNVKLAAWYTPPQNGAVILVAHGYGDRRSEDYYLLFTQKGYGVLSWDFRAHGESGGDFSSLGYYEVLDAKAALDFALAQPGVEHIGAWGGSMGAVTMIRAAAQYSEIEALVADSPFATLEDEMNLRVTLSAMRPLIRFFAERATGVSFDTVQPVDEIAKISPRPVFLIQGMEDAMVPLDSAQRLYDAAREPRQLWLEEGIGHLGIFIEHKVKYTQRVIGFFDEYLLRK